MNRLISPQLLLHIQLDDVPLGQPLVVEELGHVIPNGVWQYNDALLAGLQLLCSGLHCRIDGGAAASSWKNATTMRLIHLDTSPWNE